MNKQRFHFKPICALLLGVFAVQVAQANPIGAAVVNGQASFATQGNTLTVTNTPNTIINWQGFSIGASETTRFVQQSASSAVLNRVVTNSPSSILGSLQSNGRVFLVNPNGIVFGQGSTVNVGGLVATTLNLSNADFLAGRNSFTDVPGAQNISNAGNITAQAGGQIYLIAPNVDNSGVINAPNGEILLAAGRSVDLVNSLDPNLRVNITAPAGNATNVGQLVASSGSLGLFGTVVRNSGTVSADSATMQGGKIVFKASQRADITGTVSATGTTGGAINVLGNEVLVNAGATLDASGTNGGGTVLVGGDAHGANPNVQNALNTYVDATATIKADATQNGNGGKVVVWADGTTQFNGNISAQGGALSGNGGWVEVSGKQKLGYNGLTNTLAARGQTGSLLLDPFDFTIAAAGGNMSGAQLTAALVGANVTITTTGGAGTTCVPPACLGTLGNINVNDAVSWLNTTLILDAFGSVNIGAVMTATGTGSLTMNHGASIQGLNWNSANTSVAFSIAGTLSVNTYTTNGALALGGGNLSIMNGVAVTAGAMNVNGGNIGSWGIGAPGVLNVATFTATGAPSGLDNVILNTTGASGIGAGVNPTTLFMRNGAAINNNAGIWTMSNGSSIVQEGLVATSFNNVSTGTLTSAGISHIAGTTFKNNGIVAALPAGIDSLAVITNSGVWDITGGPNNKGASGLSQYPTVSVINNGTMFVYDPTFIYSTVIPANISLTNNGILDVAGFMSMSGSSVNSVTGVMNIHSMTNANGILAAGYMGLGGSNINNGIINVYGVAAIDISATGSLTNNGTINQGKAGGVVGAAYVQGYGYGDIYVNGGTFTNAATGVINSLPDWGGWNWVHAYNSGTITNNGTVNVTANSVMDWMNSNSSINAGTFNVAAGGLLNIVDPVTWAFNLGALTGLPPTGAAYTFNGPVNVAAGGLLDVFGVLYAPGTYTLGTLTPGVTLATAPAPVTAALNNVVSTIVLPPPPPPPPPLPPPPLLQPAPAPAPAPATDPNDPNNKAAQDAAAAAAAAAAAPATTTAAAAPLPVCQ